MFAQPLYGVDHPGGLDPGGARRLAAELLAAADLIDRRSPSCLT